MGAWGIGTFDNDSACDWAYRLEQVIDLSLVESTLDKAIDAGSEYLEAPDAEEALAAAEVVARLRGNWGIRNSYTETADAWVEKVKLTPDHALVEKALVAIERVLSEPSELLELWEASDYPQAWRESIENLRSRLRT